MPRFELNQTVMLAEALKVYGLPKGRLGAIVECFTQPSEAYEVEFVDDTGRDSIQLTLRPDQLDAYPALAPEHAA
jgi:hypothetical protein